MKLQMAHRRLKNVKFDWSVPLYPAYKAGLAGHLPVKIQYSKSPVAILCRSARCKMDKESPHPCITAGKRQVGRM
jgi:hypothetical protein